MNFTKTLSELVKYVKHFRNNLFTEKNCFGSLLSSICRSHTKFCIRTRTISIILTVLFPLKKLHTPNIMNMSTNSTILGPINSTSFSFTK